MCGLVEGEGQKCQSGKYANQIDINRNAIDTYIYNIDENGWSLRSLANIVRAYVLYDQQRRNLALECLKNPGSCLQPPRPSDFHDLGILLPKRGNTFNDFASFVVPVCLAAVGSIIPADTHNTITFVGWGKQYSESPDGDYVPDDHSFPWDEKRRNPKTTSCTTTQFGVYWDTDVEKSKFRPCRVKFLKNKVVKNGWKGCKKYQDSSDELPINYEFEKCKYYWEIAQKKIDERNDAQEMGEFEKINKIKIKSYCENWEPECLKLDLFKELGWCEVEGGNIDDWGICDTSCEHVEVLH